MSEPQPLQNLLAQARPSQPEQGQSQKDAGQAEGSQSKALPSEWVERIFQVMSASYGARFADAWRGADAQAVKAVWAKKLGQLQPAQIWRGVEQLEQCKFPPTLPEFIALCRQPTPQAHRQKLPAPRPTAEQRAQGRNRLAEMKRLLNGAA